MTNNELLLAISDMMDTKLEHITKDVQEMKKDINGIKKNINEMEKDIDEMKKDINEMKKDINEMKKDINGVKVRTDHLENEVKNIHFILENEIKPPLDNIQACYTSTFDRYKDSVEDYKDMKQDIHLMKKVIQEHSQKLQNIS